MMYVKRETMKSLNRTLLLTACYLLLTVLSGCGKNPITAVTEPVTVSKSQQWSGTWVVYNDELMTNGGVMLIGWGDNFGVDFNCRENPYQGVKCMKLYWNGGSVNISGGTTNLYTGLSLIVAKDYADYLATTKDISAGGYTKVTFYARKGFMSANTVLRVQSPNGTETSTPPTNAWEGTLTEEWKQYSLDIAGSQIAVRDFVIIVLKTTDQHAGNGATVYLDDIRLVK